MMNEENKQIDTNEHPAAVSEDNMKKVTGGVIDPELWPDGRYHVQCPYCSEWLFGNTKAECKSRLTFHLNGECAWIVIG